MQNIIFIDSEIGIVDKKIHDIGAIRQDGTIFHSPNVRDFIDFIKDAEFICGHNIVHHDLKFLAPALEGKLSAIPIDTLYLSPLLFPKRPYHALLKDDKIQSDELNNPLNDSIKAQSLFADEVTAFSELSSKLKQIFYMLLNEHSEFTGFFSYIDYNPNAKSFANLIRHGSFSLDEKHLKALIQEEFRGLICEHADLSTIIKAHPVELAYALSLIHTNDFHSITPPWLVCNFPEIENIIKLLCNTPCSKGCPYCQDKLNIHKGLKEYFGYNNFRTYNGEPLQERAAQAAVQGKSLLAVFPTGGGKSITFQLPALMAGTAAHGLTVVISPLQSLMKDQVDNLSELGITGAVTVNGLLSPVERADAYRRISDGSATLLYISPEMLRSRTIEKMLMSRNVVRFVIDEAHCFSAWGQDFRVDYLYIGDFIRKLQKQKRAQHPIPVSCFTATAKQKVISDICEYFKRKLDLDLELFASTAARENLHYTVLYKETEDEKYNALRTLIEQKNCPTIVYVSRTKRTWALAEKLTSDGFPAKPFNGKMDSKDKIANQEAFICNEIKVIVATSAFGMGVDKKDVKLVIHYDISDSLENYVQEAGRAGRDPTLQAECYVLYNDADLDKHFILLNQTKLSISEIQQVWQAIKQMTKQRNQICCSALEIARMAGWDNTVQEIETRVRTAVAALENAGYIKRGRNMPHVYATSILAKNMQEASICIERSTLFSDAQRQNAKRIIKALISSKSIAQAGNDDAESRIDYLADTLGISKSDVVSLVDMMRQDGLLADTQDMAAYIFSSDTENRTSLMLERFAKLEHFILTQIQNGGCEFYLKELNGAAEDAGVPRPNVRNIRTILYFLAIKNYIQKEEHKSSSYIRIMPQLSADQMLQKFELRIDICHFIVQELYKQVQNSSTPVDGEEKPVTFSLVGLHKAYCKLSKQKNATLQDVEDALLYLSKIGAMKLEGGFLVLYNGMEIKRIVTDNRIQYKVDDYKLLNEFYKQKIQQIHIVGEFANMMVRDYNAALQFVNDYFNMDFRKFINTYFQGDRAEEINRNITPKKYNQLFGELSDAQAKIINDNDSKYIAVVAGPGSGKTRVLVHKLAALLLLEDVKHEQLLMLTFSRAAATEFKKRLINLIGNAANFVEIKTFHSYCFDLLGKIGSLEGVENVVKNAAEMIRNGEVEPGRIAKSVLVIDEAQDIDENEFALIQALMYANDEMRVIAVGDDDQNIYEFRGSDSKYLRSLVTDYGAVLYELDDNYRSKNNIVKLSNEFVKPLQNRLKTNDIVSVSDQPGKVQLIHHCSRHLEEAVVNHLLHTRTDGSCCILTNTNDESLRILGLLLQKGIHAKLIQSTDDFSLYNLTEIRFFLMVLKKVSSEPVISDKQWEYAKERLKTTYHNSSCLENCLNMISDFETIYPVKYQSDLDEFIKESNYEDFYSNEQGSLYISTIHKSKGREFDTVYMMLDQVLVYRDEDRRKLYVALTRAKEALYIHYNNNLFDSLNTPGIEKISDSHSYLEPHEIALQLTHRDVVLDFFKDKKSLIFKLHSGSPLCIYNGYLFAKIHNSNKRIGKLSRACVLKLEQLQKNGYIPYKSDVRFIVAWKGEEDTEETAVILPSIYLKKQ